MFWILLGVLIVLFVRNNFNTQGVAKDIRRIAGSVRQIVMELVRAVRGMVKDAKKETAEARTESPEQVSETVEVPAAEPVRAEVQQNSEMLQELEQNARTAAMLANVPTIDFPQDDQKYDSSRKYSYA